MFRLTEPSEDVDVMVSIPGRPDTAFSTGLAIKSSVSGGAAPAYWIETNTAGKLIAGKRSTFMRVYETAPIRTRPTINIRIASGRVIANRVRAIECSSDPTSA